MADSPPNPELLRSLGQLVRGLSVLFWGLPSALVVCVQSAHADYLRFFGPVPPVVTTAILLYGLILLGPFRREEGIWVAALERAKILAVVNLGLSPFLFWWSRVPSQAFYAVMLELLALTGLLFLLALGPVLRRLTAMLPDENLRHETLVFTRMNAALLLFNVGILVLYFTSSHLRPTLSCLREPLLMVGHRPLYLVQAGQWGVWFSILLTMALTMALIWKTKEVIFHSVFGGKE
jgi:hypothetical protein